jgi:hypothetical protein
MPGFVATTSTTVTCTHQGKASPIPSKPSVTIMQIPVVTIATQYQIAACQLPSMTSGAPPCATGLFTSGATKVTSMGSPLVVQSSSSTCAPTAQPMIILAPSQTKVTAT